MRARARVCVRVRFHSLVNGALIDRHAWWLARVLNAGEVWVNGSLVATCETDLRKPHDNVKVYMADPWHSPALAYLRNVRYQRISYHHSNFYNQFTDYDDEDSVDEIVAGLVDLTDEHSDVLDSLEVSGATALSCPPCVHTWSSGNRLLS